MKIAFRATLRVLNPNRENVVGPVDIDLELDTETLNITNPITVNMPPYRGQGDALIAFIQINKAETPLFQEKWLRAGYDDVVSFEEGEIEIKNIRK